MTDAAGTMDAAPDTDAGPEITRVRYDIRWRNLGVTQVERITPMMVRVTLAGPDLDGFDSQGFDDHVKLAMQGNIDENGTRDDWREFTPRRYDAEHMVIDFALHGKGLASDWAERVQPGDRLDIGGPRGSRIVSGGVDGWLLVGDETALPPIGRFLEEAAPGLPVTVIGIVAGPEEEQVFDTRADARCIWVHRPLAQAADPTAVVAAVRDLPALPPRTFAWIAAETGVSHAVRAALTEAGHPEVWLSAKGYWQER